jgi:hypothetical protein
MYTNLVESAPTMNNSEAREHTNAQAYLAAGMPDIAARAMSALVRACRTQCSYSALMAASREMGIDQHPDFVL